ncbi:hypothetical protein C8J57DRAFT_1213949 [Mycena rebaudengoi]|nr:hypothetical protein C8J57DRAFT_1213949 [Mycena rebaudengoi]
MYKAQITYKSSRPRCYILSCFHALRCTSQLPTFSRELASSTRAALLLGLIVYLSLIPVCHASPPWTPEDFDWNSLPVAPREQWGGRYLNLTEYPLPNHPKIALLMEIGEPGKIDGTNVLFIPFVVGLAWQGLNVAVGIGSVVTAIQGCATSDGSAGSVAGCVFGLAGTVLSIGSAFKAAHAAGWLAKANNGFGGSGIENIALDVFSKRMQELHQERHDDLMRRSSSWATRRRRTARGEGHLHPHAPVFRFMHRRHGRMDIVSREHANSTRFTISYAAPGKRIGKRQSFQHETLSNDLFEARFDGGVEAQDPGADFNAASGYQQMFDNSGMEKFAFASMGIFADDGADSTLEAFTPRFLLPAAKRRPFPAREDGSHNPQVNQSV